jgi:hypothetical protein
MITDDAMTHEFISLVTIKFDCTVIVVNDMKVQYITGKPMLSKNLNGPIEKLST